MTGDISTKLTLGGNDNPQEVLVEGLRWLMTRSDGLIFDMCWVAAVTFNRSHWKYRSYLYALASCMLFSFGGGFTSRLVMGHPQGIWGSDRDVPTAMLVWFFMFFTPLPRLYAFFPVKILCVIGESICWMRCLCSVMDIAVERYHGAVFGSLALGTLAGSGGGLWMRMECQLWGIKPSADTHGIKMSFLAAVFYYSQHDWMRSHGFIPASLDLVSSTDASVIVGCLLVVWAVIAEVWTPINPFAPFESFARATFLRYPEEDAKSRRDKEGGESFKAKTMSVGESKYLTKTASPVSTSFKKKKRTGDAKDKSE